MTGLGWEAAERGSSSSRFMTEEEADERRGRRTSRTDAGGGGEVSFVAHVAVAEEGADGVDALAVTTRILQHLALVDVCRQNRKCLAFSSKSDAQG